MNSAALKNLFFQHRNNKPLILDGAMGSYIQQKGYVIDDIIWTTRINFSNPDAIISIHKEYIDAGADIITTNTFRTNPASLEAINRFDFGNFVKAAVDLAKQASVSSKVFIAGSNPPAEDCYQVKRTLNYKKLEVNHKYHIDLLIENGVDFILNETQSHTDEIQIICQHCDRNSIPYVVSLYLDENLKLLSGETVDYVLTTLKDHNPMSIGFNCISKEVFQKLLGSIKLPMLWGFYLNCGSGKPQDKIITCGVDPEEYLQILKTSIEFYPSFVGSCCGSDPSHTKKIREFLNGKYYC